MSARVLIVDDDQPFRTMLGQTLRGDGFETEEAADGVIAVHHLRESEFDIVISDIMMPRSTGMDLLKWVRENQPQIPVILVTGFSDLHDGPKALSNGAAALIPKPFKKEEILAKIRAALSGEKEPEPEPSIDDQFCKIPIDDFVSGKMINIDIYVRISPTKYVMIAHTGEDISAGQVAAYKAKNLHYLHVTKEDFKKYVGFGASLSKAVINSSKIDHHRKVNFVRHTSEVIVQRFFSTDVDAEALNQARTMVENSVSLLTDQADAFKLLESLNQQSDFTYAHSVGVSFYSTLIARKLEWRTPSTLCKLGMAGLLHDIGKKELPPELIDKPRPELSPAEVAIYETHAARGMEILGRLREIPSDVVLATLQHHENGIGTGYPSRLKMTKIHPFARVIAVADEFCYLTLSSLSGKGLPPQEALQRLIQLQGEKLDADAMGALFGVFRVSPPTEALENNRKLQKLSRVAWDA